MIFFFLILLKCMSEIGKFIDPENHLLRDNVNCLVGMGFHFGLKLIWNLIVLTVSQLGTTVRNSTF